MQRPPAICGCSAATLVVAFAALLAASAGASDLTCGVDVPSSLDATTASNATATASCNLSTTPFDAAALQHLRSAQSLLAPSLACSARQQCAADRTLCAPAATAVALPPVLVVCRLEGAVPGGAVQWVNTTRLLEFAQGLRLQLVTPTAIINGLAAGPAVALLDPRTAVPVTAPDVVAARAGAVAIVAFANLQLVGATRRGRATTLCLTHATAAARSSCRGSPRRVPTAAPVVTGTSSASVLLSGTATPLVVLGGAPAGIAVLRAASPNGGLTRATPFLARTAAPPTRVAGDIAPWATSGLVVVLPPDGDLGVAFALVDRFGNVVAPLTDSDAPPVLLRLTIDADSYLEPPPLVAASPVVVGSLAPVAAAEVPAVALLPSGGPLLLAAHNATTRVFATTRLRAASLAHGVRYRLTATASGPPGAFAAATLPPLVVELRRASCPATWSPPLGRFQPAVGVNGSAACTPVPEGAHLVALSDPPTTRPTSSEVFSLATADAAGLAVLPAAALWTTVRPGYWRESPSSPLYPCVHPESCLGGVNSTCAPLAHGPLCYKCAPGSVKDEFGTCYACPAFRAATLVPVTCSLCTFVLIALIVVPKWRDEAHVPAAAVLFKVFLALGVLLAVNQPLVARAKRAVATDATKIPFLFHGLVCAFGGTNGLEHGQLLGVVAIGALLVSVAAAAAGVGLARRRRDTLHAARDAYVTLVTDVASTTDIDGGGPAPLRVDPDAAPDESSVNPEFVLSMRSSVGSSTAQRDANAARAVRVYHAMRQELQMQRVALDMLRAKRLERERAVNDEIVELPRSFERRRQLQRETSTSSLGASSKHDADDDHTFISAAAAVDSALRARRLAESDRSSKDGGVAGEELPDDRSIELLLRDERVERDNFVLARIERARRAVDPLLVQLAEREILDAVDVVQADAALHARRTQLDASPEELAGTAPPLAQPPRSAAAIDAATLQTLPQAVAVLLAAENAAAVATTLPKQPARSAASAQLLVAPSARGNAVLDGDGEWEVLESEAASRAADTAFWSVYDRREMYFYRPAHGERTWVRPSFVHPADVAGVLWNSGSRLGLSVGVAGTEPLTASVARARAALDAVPLPPSLAPGLLQRPGVFRDSVAATAVTTTAAPLSVALHACGVCVVCRVRDAEAACRECGGGVHCVVYCGMCWATAHHPDTPSKPSVTGASNRGTRRSAAPSRRRLHARLPLDAAQAASAPYAPLTSRADFDRTSSTAPRCSTPELRRSDDSCGGGSNTLSRVASVAPSAFQVGYDAAFRELWMEGRGRPMAFVELATVAALFFVFFQLPFLVYFSTIYLGGCRTLPGVNRRLLLWDPNVDCDADGFKSLATVNGAVLCIFALGTMAWFGLYPLLLRKRGVLLQRRALARFSFVYSNLRPRCCYYQGVETMVIVAAVVLTTLFVDQPQWLLPSAALVVLLSLGVQLWLQPFRKGRLYLRVTAANHAAVLVGLMLSLFYNGGDLRSHNHNERSDMPAGHRLVFVLQAIVIVGAVLVNMGLLFAALRAYVMARVDVTATVVASWQEGVIFARARAYATHKRTIDAALAAQRRRWEGATSTAAERTALGAPAENAAPVERATEALGRSALRVTFAEAPAVSQPATPVVSQPADGDSMAVASDALPAARREEV